MKAVNFKEALNMVNRLSEKDKHRFLIELKIGNLLGEIRRKARGLKITDEEITAEVEFVRQKKYKKMT